MEVGLGLDNILGENDIETLFLNPEDTASPEGEEEEADTSEEEVEVKDKKESTTEAVDPESLFEEEEKQSESVGSGKEGKEKEDTIPDSENGTSPQTDFYSSIANALAVDGIFPNLDEETVKNASDAESFSALIEAEVTARLDDKQKRVIQALDNGVDADEIRKYEGTLQYINGITEAQINAETEQGEQLRKTLIYQDFINSGYTPERAQKLTDRSINAGTDIEDAKEALQSNKKFFTEKYQELQQNAQEEADKVTAERAKQFAKLKDSILKDKTLLGDTELSNDVRKKTVDNITKPVYRDPETGQYMTAVQKYEMENRSDFLKYVGLIYTLTNGFKDFDSFTKGKVKKEVKKGLRELEHTLNSTNRDAAGNLKMVTTVNEDPNSYFGKGMKLDI